MPRRKTTNNKNKFMRIYETVVVYMFSALTIAFIALIAYGIVVLPLAEYINERVTYPFQLP